jgi:hypothetical protein
MQRLQCSIPFCIWCEFFIARSLSGFVSDHHQYIQDWLSELKNCFLSHLQCSYNLFQNRHHIHQAINKEWWICCVLKKYDDIWIYVYCLLADRASLRMKRMNVREVWRKSQYEEMNGYWLLLCGGIVQGVPSTAYISDLLCVHICVLISPIHPLMLYGYTRDI